MENKTVFTKVSKKDQVIEFHKAFGWNLVGEPSELPKERLALCFERDPEALGDSYKTIMKAEKLHRKFTRNYPLGTVICFLIATTLLVLFLTLQKAFRYYILFLYFSLTFYCVGIYLLIVFLVILTHRQLLLERLRKKVGADAGTIKEYPIEKNVKEETDNSWLISSNL